MKNLDNLQKTLYLTWDLLRKNSNIGKLLYYDTASALEQEIVDINTVTNYIFLSPVFDTTNEPYNKNTFITMNINKGVKLEEKILESTLRINVISQHDLWKINNYKVRTLELVNQIIDELNYKKFNTSHKLEFQGFDLVVLDKNLSGYAIIFSVLEGVGLENEF